MSLVRLPRSRWVRVAVVAALVAVAGVVLWWRGPNWSQVGHSFTRVSWPWVIAAIALNLISVLVRALCWWSIVGQATSRPRFRYSTVLSGYAIGLMANAILPGRVGEVARVGVLRRKSEARRGLWPTLIGTVVAHRLFDLIPAAGLVIWVIVAARMPTWAFSSLVAVVIVGAVLFAAGVAGATTRDRRFRADRVGPLRRAIAFARLGLAVLRAPRVMAAAAVFQIAGWLCQLFAVWAAMRAFQIDLPLVAAGLVLALMNVANILPLWPGNVGLLQAAIALPLISYGIRYGHGFAFGIGLQAIEASVGIGYGLAFLAKEGIRFAALSQPIADDAEEPRHERALPADELTEILAEPQTADREAQRR